MNHVLFTVAGLLADDAPRNSGPDFGKASPFGLLVIVLLLLGTFALVWSMNRQLKKVPSSFDDDDTAAEPGTTAEPGALDTGRDGDDGSSREPAG